MGCSSSSAADPSAPASGVKTRAPAVTASAVTSSGTTIACEFDGCFASYDRLKREFIVTAKNGSVITVRQVPVRPNKPSGVSTTATTTAPTAMVTHQGTGEKLGHKKQLVSGAAVWQQRWFKLNGQELSYYGDSSYEGVAKGVVNLAPGCTVRVIQANDAARKDRYEDQDASLSGMMTQPMGAVLTQTSGPIGKPNCVELQIPAAVGDMLGGVMNASPVGMMAGGGLADLKKSQARTYYWSCETLAEAEAWVTALDNNIKLAKAKDLPTSVGGVNLGQVDGALAMARNMQNDQKNMTDPNESLGWYHRSLGAQLSMGDLHAKLMPFYDQLQSAGAV